MSSDEESTTCEENNQVKFVDLLQKFKVLLEKSQVPTTKKQKLLAEWQAMSGKALSVKQLMTFTDPKEVTETITSLQDKKAPGLNGIRSATLKSIKQTILSRT